jgi:O-antigen/teichoic acid export membrane protein
MDNKERETILSDSFFMTGAVIVTFIFSIPSSIISAKILGPSLLGIMKILILIQSYSGLSQLGFLNAIKRESTIYLGKGDKEKAEEIKDIGLTNAFILLLVTVLIIWMLYLYGIFESKNITFLMIAIITVLVLFNRIQSSISAYLVSTAKFKSIAFNNTLNGVLAPIFAIIFVLYFRNVEGLLIASLIVSSIVITNYLYILKKIGFFYKININIKKSIEIWKPNFIIYLNNLSGSILWTVDILLISIFLSITEVGWYGVALAAVSIAKKFSQAINKPILRKIIYDRGKYGLKDVERFKSYFEKPLTIYVFYCSLCAGILCLSYTWLIQYYLTAYQQSIFPLFVLTIGVILIGAFPMFSFYLNVTDQFMMMFLSRIIFIIFNLTFDIFAIKAGYGINGVAIVSTFTCIIYVTWITTFVFKQIYRDHVRKSVFFLTKLFLITSLLSVFIWFFGSITKGTNINYGLVYKIFELVIINMLYVVFITLIYSVIFKKQQIYKEIINIAKTIFYKTLSIKGSSIMGISRK